MSETHAKFNQSRNDLHWSFWAGEDKFIVWGGYDDGFWWNNVANTEHFTDRKGKATGKTYRLDPATNLVTVL